MKKAKTFIPQIDCPIFSEQEEKIKQLTQSINGAKIISNEVDKAQELLSIVNILLICPKYNREKEDCENCRLFLHVQEEIAKSIIKASKVTY